jgi:PAS domain-containing protein
MLLFGLWIWRQRSARTGLWRSMPPEERGAPTLNDHQFDGLLEYLSESQRGIALKEQSEARFTKLLETLQEGVYFSTPEGRILDVNLAMVRLLGYDGQEELMAQAAVDTYPNPEEASD